MRHHWRLVRVIGLMHDADDEVVLRDGFSETPPDEMKHWNGDALGLSAVDAYEAVIIRLQDQEQDIDSVEYVTFKLQVMNPSSHVWKTCARSRPSVSGTSRPTIRGPTTCVTAR